MAVAHTSALFIGARSFPSNPYDCHTVVGQIEQITSMLQDIDVKHLTAAVCPGYRGADHLVPVNIIHRGRHKALTERQRKWLKRRQDIESTIGHETHDHVMRRCWLKGSGGDALHAVLCAPGLNIRWLLRTVARGGVAALLFALLGLCVALRCMRETLVRGHECKQRLKI